ncbi:MAG: DUF2018 family protein [Sulfurospirillaceae bacterium]|nr:DUF2018 family protein [Sulfurospirillaceae bacterium]
MLYEDEDDYFVGSPKSKFFDIVFNANRSLVEESISGIVERYSAMELLLEEFIQDERELEYRINEIKNDRSDELVNRNNSLYILATGEVLTQHE